MSLKLTAEQIEFIEGFKNTGILNEDKESKLVFDMVRQTYLYIRGTKITILKDLNSAKKICNSDIGWIPENILVKECPVVYYVFNPFNDNLEYEENGDKFINSFHVQETFLDMRDIVEERIPLDKIDEVMETRFPAFNILFKNLFREKEGRTWYLNRLALIANTRRKVPTTALIHGEEGAGKGTFVEYVLKPLFGERYVHTAGNEAINSKENAAFENKLYIIFNEVKTDLKGLAIEKLKALITDKDLEIKRLYMNTYTIENIFNCDFFSNHHNAIKISTSNRRFSVFNTGPMLNYVLEQKGINAKKYFEEDLLKEQKQFLLFVMSLDYDEKLAYSIVKNQELDDIVEATSTNIEKTIHMLKNAEFDKIRDKIVENISYRIAMGESYHKDYEVMLEGIKKNLKEGKIEITYLPFIYNVLVDSKETSSNKIGRSFSNLGQKVRGTRTYRRLLRKYVEKTGEELSDSKTLQSLKETIKANTIEV